MMAVTKSKLDQRLEAAIKGTRFYEAHQLYKTIYFRCTTKKNYAEAVNYLFSGSEFLLEHEQWESGTELACLVIDVLNKSKTKLTDEHLDQLCSLLIRMNPGEERSGFINKTLQLLNNDKEFLAKFNGYLGKVLFQEGALTKARFYIMLSSNGFAAGKFLIVLHQQLGLRSEVDLFITQAVLQFLCMQQISVAALTFHTYTRGHPGLEPGPPFVHFPLLNFIWFLMMAIEKKSGLPVFYILCEKYSSQLNRDSSYTEYLDKIAQLYFGVKPKKNYSNNLFSRLFQVLGASDERNDPEESTSHSSCFPNKICFEDVD